MKKLFIIANWKSNKNISESNEWIQKTSNLKPQTSNLTNKEIIICPSFTLMPGLKSSITNYQLPIILGAQDISYFDEGQYTGEVNGKQIKEFADYVIIGHSERRSNFGEDEGVIAKKLKLAIENKLTPILCVSDINQISNSSLQPPASKILVAYEPLSAVGSGIPDTPEDADSVAQKIKSKLSGACVLYGGSVTSDNVKTFTNMPNIDGVLVGSSSLDPLEFLAIVENA